MLIWENIMSASLAPIGPQPTPQKPCLILYSEWFVASVKRICAIAAGIFVALVAFFVYCLSGCRPKSYPQNTTRPDYTYVPEPSVPSLRGKSVSEKRAAYTDLHTTKPVEFMQKVIALYKANLEDSDKKLFAENLETSVEFLELLGACVRSIIISATDISPSQRPHFLNSYEVWDRGEKVKKDPWPEIVEARQKFDALSPTEQLAIIDSLPTGTASEEQRRTGTAAADLRLSENGRFVVRTLLKLASEAQSHPVFIESLRVITRPQNLS
ncbi:MAG: hypothetical protein HY069_01130 [Chlamydiia bacterium]|nr:hypothetical protein [Chlamydiia bacterium]